MLWIAHNGYAVPLLGQKIVREGSVVPINDYQFYASGRIHRKERRICTENDFSWRRVNDKKLMSSRVFLRVIGVHLIFDNGDVSPNIRTSNLSGYNPLTGKTVFVKTGTEKTYLLENTTPVWFNLLESPVYCTSIEFSGTVLIYNPPTTATLAKLLVEQ